MKTLEKISLFSSKKDFLLFFIFTLTLFFLSISYQYYSYHQLTKFDSQLVNAVVLKQYTKTKTTKKGKLKTYQVLKLKADDGFTFYTTANKNLENIKRKTIKLELFAGKVTFYQYMKTFFAFSKILKISHQENYHKKISTFISKQHKDQNISSIYKALFLAQPLQPSLQTQFSNLGISHLVAISGFHLGVLSFILFFIIKYPYKFLQSRYFPYRSYKRDSFIIISLLLFSYMMFLDYPPSLLRAFFMFVIGFILYERGVKIISMQTLSITVILLLALMPRLSFSIGFWLSVSGVFYIFLFFIYFSHWSKIKQFLLLPFWVYLMMLPYSLTLFGNFTLYHPLSILWTTLFSLFYPLSIFFHLINHGDLLDSSLKALLHINLNAVKELLAFRYLVYEVILSLFAIWSRKALVLLLFYTLSIFIYLIYNVS
ncbi:ComEC/Rec2 family competence protein [Sulfurimonas sp.]